MDEPPYFGFQPEPGSYDYPDPDEDRRRRAETSLREQRLREVEASILSTPTGREWLWGVLSSLSVFEPRIAMSTSAYENGFWAGQREAGLRLMRAFVRHDPADFARLIQENDK
jgi:hypothetical protein